MKCISIIHIKTQNEEYFFIYIDKNLHKYNLEGSNITIIHSDYEFKPLTDKVKDEFYVTINYANPGDHVTEIVQNNRRVKEIYRAQYHRLTFQNIPKVIIRYLSFEVVIKLNCFTFKGGLSPYHSPQTITDQQPLGYKIHCTITFGAFIQSNNDNNPKNSNGLQTIYSIYLRSSKKYKADMIYLIYTVTDLLQDE